jgi:cytidylate kinase
MSIVAISPTLGSQAEEIGRHLAQALGYEFADREILLTAAEQFGADPGALSAVTKRAPTLWDRFTDTKRQYRAAVESVLWEVAARDRVVLVGRGATWVLREVGHTLRVRITAPRHVRARRVEMAGGLLPDAMNLVAHSDWERATWMRFLHNTDWDDPCGYDLVLNTERVDVADASQAIRVMLDQARFQPTVASLAIVRDRCVSARVEAVQQGWAARSGRVDSPRLLAVVRRGASERFRYLQDVLAGVPAQVVWDRRLTERRHHPQLTTPERRQRDRRSPPSSLWDLVDCAIIDSASPLSASAPRG